MAARAAGRGSSHGIDRAILETGLGSARAVLAADLPEAGRRRPDVGSAPSCAGAVQSRAARGRKRDFPDAERLVKRLVAQELTLSFVPNAEQRLWRTVMRRKYQLTRNRVQLQNRLEALLDPLRHQGNERQQRLHAPSRQVRL